MRAWPARAASSLARLRPLPPPPPSLAAPRWPWPGRAPAAPPPATPPRPGDPRSAWEAGRGQAAAWAHRTGSLPVPFPVDPPANAHEAAFRLLSAAMAERPADVLHALADRVLRDRSRGTSARNHAVAERAALALAARLLPASPRAPRFRSVALELPALLDREVDDGTGIEQSVGYLLQDLEWGLVAWAAGVPGLEGPLARGASALASMLDGDGALPDLGDDDGGRVFPAGASHRERLGAVAQALGLPGPVGYVPGPVAAWLGLGPSVAGAPAAGFAGRDATVLRRGPHLAVVRHGRPGAAPTFAHAHADALAVWWAPGGGAWVVGGRGTGTYLADPLDRRFRRGSRAVATVVVDGRDHAEPHDHPFLWRRTAEAHPLGRGPHEVRATVRAGDHGLTRAVTLGPDGALTLEDRIEGAGRHHVAVAFPLRPGARAEVRPDPRLSVRVRADTHAVAYGVTVPAATLVAEGVVDLPVTLRTVLGAPGE